MSCGAAGGGVDHRGVAIAASVAPSYSLRAVIQKHEQDV